MADISPVALHALQMAMQNELDTVRIYKKMLKKVKTSDLPTDAVYLPGDGKFMTICDIVLLAYLTLR